MAALGKLLRTTAFQLTLVYLFIFVVFAASLPFLLALSFLENHTPTRHGSGLLAIVRKPAAR